MARRIDAHQHFWRYRRETHAWIDDSMRALKRDFLPDDLRPLLAAAGFDGSVAVQAQQDVSESEWLLRLAEKHPFILGVVGWVDLRRPDVADELQRFAAHPRFRGVRHVAQDEPDDRFLVQPEFIRGIAVLVRFGLTYDILIYPRQLPAAIELARRFPEQRFVVDHIAKPPIREKRVDEWARGIRALATSANVCCKLSGMVTEADWQNWKPSDFTPYLDVVLDCFGPQRLMIGSDWPVCTLTASYGQVIGLVSDYIGALSMEEQGAILGENAARFYGLDSV